MVVLSNCDALLIEDIMKRSTFFCVLITSLMMLEVSASDLARERRLAAEIEDAIMDGDGLYLKAGGHEFFNIYTEAESEEARGAAIILHGRGFHPDWEDVVQPLRVGLTTHGWSTLAMQMPVLEKDAKYYDYVPEFPAAVARIESGIDYLKEQGYDNVVLIAHSCSVHMSMAGFREQRFPQLDAFVGIGMGATDYKQPMKQPFPLASMKLPVLDIFGSEEYPAVLRGAPERLQMIRRAGNERSEQLEVPGAEHYFRDKGELLTGHVARWLNGLKP